jgi:predicted ester cyclase
MSDQQAREILMGPDPGPTDPVSVAIRSIHTMASGRRADFDEVVHPAARDRENKVQPPSSRVPGPAGFYSTAMWLRAAFADLHYDIHYAVADGDLVAVNSTMNGRHVDTFVVYREDGDVDAAFPPTGRTFAMAQSHWCLFKDGKIIEHWATRDDLGQARQLGWLPPSPAYLIRCALAKRRAVRAARRSGR